MASTTAQFEFRGFCPVEQSAEAMTWLPTRQLAIAELVQHLRTHITDEVLMERRLVAGSEVVVP